MLLPFVSESVRHFFMQSSKRKEIHELNELTRNNPWGYSVSFRGPVAPVAWAAQRTPNLLIQNRISDNGALVKLIIVRRWSIKRRDLRSQ